MSAEWGIIAQLKIEIAKLETELENMQYQYPDFAHQKDFLEEYDKKNKLLQSKQLQLDRLLHPRKYQVQQPNVKPSPQPDNWAKTGDLNRMLVEFDNKRKKKFPNVEIPKIPMPTAALSQGISIGGSLVGGAGGVAVKGLGDAAKVMGIATIVAMSSIKAEAETTNKPDPQLERYFDYVCQWIDYAIKQLEKNNGNFRSIKALKTFTQWKKNPSI